MIEEMGVELVVDLNAAFKASLRRALIIGAAGGHFSATSC